ncbi:MAG: DUF2071 domain-containing protein [Raineya sp.]|jgi:uncharacterized protein YqjF (DUF2071 family)|nr:DUF2071 domain-containing protein [Raineya sp.]
MLAFFKNHPFAVEAFFESSLVLTYAVPYQEVLSLIPECLEPDTFQDKWAFIAIAMVQTKNLRPKGFPKFLGNDFFLIGYRVFVRYHTNAGKRLRGLYILKSETNKKKMEFFGNIFTHYNYTTTDIQYSKNQDIVNIHSQKSDFKLKVEAGNDDISLPSSSPFQDWKEARRFAGPLPFTFTYKKEKSEVLIIEGVREDWHPQPIKVEDASFKFLEKFNFSEIHLANAFIIKNIPYYWKKGRIEVWNKSKEAHSKE